jgi:hypothetical protein
MVINYREDVIIVSHLRIFLMVRAMYEEHTFIGKGIACSIKPILAF